MSRYRLRRRPTARRPLSRHAYFDWTCVDAYNWGSSSEDGGSEADWIRDALAVALPNDFPRVKALVWFNWNADGMDWAIESSATAHQAFADSIALPYYAANEFGALEGGLIGPSASAAALTRSGS